MRTDLHDEANTVMRRLKTGIRSEKCVVRRFRHCANVVECTYTNLDSTPKLSCFHPVVYIYTKFFIKSTVFTQHILCVKTVDLMKN